jgi:alkanesulfonate monooxygenase SsuD/methylene tetrahydromethanopterin reductase-like flavin-dependent oxidoreductase (luciferase family)
MEFAIQFRGDFEDALRSAKWAEHAGLAAFAMPDHYLQRGDTSKPAWDHLVHLAALARETDRIELVSLVTAVNFRHPAVLYKMGVTLDEVSNGRFSLGIGAGWFDQEFELFGFDYPDLSTRYEMTEEALQYIRAALSDEARPFHGEHYRLADFDPGPNPKNLRLVVGGTGDTKTPRLAGMYADEYNIYVCGPREYSAKAQTAAAAAESAGRQPDEISLTAAGPAVAAREESDYRRILKEVAELTGVSPDRIEETYREREFPHGFGSQPAEMAAALEEAGCQRLYLQMFAVGPEQFDIVLDAYAPR